MMRGLATFVALASATPALAQDLTLVAGHNHFCVLDAAGAKCWGGARRGVAVVGLPGGPCLSQPSSQACKEDDARVAPRFTLFARPDRIWAGGETTCVHDTTGLHCFGRVATPVDGPRLRDPAAVAVGPGHVCLHHDEAYKCYGMSGQWIDSNGRGSVLPDASPSPPELMAAGALSTCVASRSDVRCHLGPPLNSAPRYDDGALALGASLVDVCYLTREHNCQGLADGPVALRCRKLTPAAAFPTSSDFTVCPHHLRQPTAVAVGPTHTCVLDADGVACVDRRQDLGHFPSMKRLPVMGAPSQIAVAESTLCAVEGMELRCHDLDRGVPKPPPLAPTDLAAFGFRLESMHLNLRKLADFVYEDKAKLFVGLAASAERHPLSDGPDAAKARLFVLNVIAPVIDRTETPFFDRAVRPAFERRLASLNAEHGIASLADFRGAGPRRIALDALRLGLEGRATT